MLSFQIESLSLGKGGLPRWICLSLVTVKRNMSLEQKILAQLRHIDDQESALKMQKTART
jgi:hypothetical protein